MRLLPILALLLIASFAFADPIPLGWNQPKQEIAIPAVTDILSALPLLVAAIVLELLVSFIVLRLWKLDYGILKTVLSVNIISISIVWAYCFAVAPFFFDWHGDVGTENPGLILFVILSAEAFAVAFESLCRPSFQQEKNNASAGRLDVVCSQLASFPLIPGMDSGTASIIGLLIPLLMLPFVAVYFARLRLGLKKYGIWRIYACHVLALMLSLIISVSIWSYLHLDSNMFAYVSLITVLLIAEFLLLMLVNWGIDAKKAAILALALVGSIVVGGLSLLYWAKSPSLSR